MRAEQEGGGPPGPEHDADLDSLANERTMLAWIRTGFALVAAGALALHAVEYRLELRALVIGVGTITMGVGVWGIGYLRFRAGARAIATEDPLLPLGSVRFVTFVAVAAAAGALLLALVAI